MATTMAIALTMAMATAWRDDGLDAMALRPSRDQRVGVCGGVGGEGS